MNTKVWMIVAAIIACAGGVGTVYVWRSYTVPVTAETAPSVGETTGTVDKPPYSLAQLKASERLTQRESQACEQGQYDGQPWKADYCTASIGQAKSAHYFARGRATAQRMIDQK